MRDNLDLHCYQIAGYSKSGRMGWKNIEVADIVRAEMTETCFTVRPDYKPENGRIFKKIEASVPKAGTGRTPPRSHPDH